MHGQYIRSMYRQLINEEGLFLWLLRGDLKEESESEIITGQVQASQTKYHATKLLQQKQITNADSDEKVEHNISACPILIKEQYIKRHARVCV
jgi:hypothetical protein